MKLGDPRAPAPAPGTRLRYIASAQAQARLPCDHCPAGAIAHPAQCRRSNFRPSLNQSTPLAIATHTPHWPAESGTVPKARFRKGSCTTAPCRAVDNATAAHSQRFENAARNVDAVAERALKQLKSCASTSTVKAAVRVSSRLCGPGPI